MLRIECLEVVNWLKPHGNNITFFLKATENPFLLILRKCVLKMHLNDQVFESSDKETKR